MAHPLPLLVLPEGDKSSPETAYSLRRYCPTPGEQGTLGTCLGWAIGYGMMTIHKAIKDGLTRQADINNAAYSAYYVLNKGNRGCKGDVFDTTYWSNVSICRTQVLSNDTQNCGLLPDSIADKDARHACIKGWMRVFEDADDIPKRLMKMRQTLRQNKPMLIIAKPYETLRYNTSGYWSVGSSMDTGTNHALVIIGYKVIGNIPTFEVMNSWGDKWRDKGFVHIDCNSVLKMIVDEEGYRFPLVCDMEDLEPSSGIGKIQDSNNKSIVVNYNTQQNVYKTLTHKWEKGAGFELILHKIPKGKYIYVFSLYNKKVEVDYTHVAENTGNITIPTNRLFKIDYKSAELCILYANEPIDIDNYTKQMKSMTGKCYDRIKKVLGDKLALDSKIIYEPNQLAYHYLDEGKNEAVVPIIIELETQN